MKLMQAIRHLFTRPPSPTLSAAIREHEEAVRESNAMTETVSKIAEDTQRNAAAALELVDRTWRVQRR